jgi:hypothetical protein
MFSLALVAALAAMASLVIPASPASAMVYNGPVDLGCDSFTATGLLVADRDNTGINQELIQVDIFDGTENRIYSQTFQNFLGDYTAGLTGNSPLFYDELPDANPLRFVLVSLAGNGFSEQLVLEATGSCNEVPTVNCSLTEESPPIEPEGTFAPAAIVQHPGVCAPVDITKHVNGAILPDATFHVTVTCQAPPEEPDEEQPLPAELPVGVSPPATVNLTFPAEGGTQTVYIGEGSCTVTETDLPAGCSLNSITPASFEIADLDSPEPALPIESIVTNTCAVSIEPAFTG